MGSRRTVLYTDHFPDVAGGQEALITRLKHLDTTTWRPVVIVPSVCGQLHQRLDKLGVKTVPRKLNVGDIRGENEKDLFTRPAMIAANTVRVPKAMFDIFSTIQTENVDLIHTNSFKSAVLSVIPAQLTGVPFVHHAHSSRMYSNHGWFDSFDCEHDAILAANSSFTAATYSRWEDRTRVIYNAIETNRFQPAEADPASVRREFDAESSPLIGEVARLTPRKRQEDLVAAMPRILDRHPKTRLLLVGGEYEGLGAYADTIRSMIAEHNLREAVSVTGYRDDIVSTIAALDILVLPSIQEPLGRVVIEALLLETPVVATNSGGIPEIVDDGETGILVPERDPEAIATAVSELLDTPERLEAMGKRGREQVLERFSCETIIPQLDALYREILAEA
jgi:glycosyltransferase involved in cell wall biosynthesis